MKLTASGGSLRTSAKSSTNWSMRQAWQPNAVSVSTGWMTMRRAIGVSGMVAAMGRPSAA
uniref:leucine zipper domain-containing protein n=1 Tax=Paraburkholderia guartelaensis TaxID=2546446 RepID=UPI0038BD7521